MRNQWPADKYSEPISEARSVPFPEQTTLRPTASAPIERSGGVDARLEKLGKASTERSQQTTATASRWPVQISAARLNGTIEINCMSLLHASPQRTWSRFSRRRDHRPRAEALSQQYLDAVQRRFGTLPGIELHFCDLAQSDLNLPPVDLVHAALIFEHAGLGRTLTNALSLLAHGGRFSAVLQLPSESEQAVACTAFASIQTLKEDFTLIDVDAFQRLLAQQQFEVLEHVSRSVPCGKALWLGIFAKHQ